jgi:hypothetical protein
MNQVIDILRISTERHGKASQTWQQGYNLIRKTGMICHPSVSQRTDFDIYSVPPRDCRILT